MGEAAESVKDSNVPGNKTVEITSTKNELLLKSEKKGHISDEIHSSTKNELHLKFENKDIEIDPLVEITTLTGTEVVHKSQIKDFDTLVVKCTICRSQINHLDRSGVKRHRKLGVVICKECYNFYGKEEFTRDENGNYNYCTWCGNGGKLFLCEFCPHVYCSKCVRHNLGRSEVAIMEKDGWKCYVCDSTKLKTKIAYCDLVLEYSKNNTKKKKKADLEPLGKKKLISETWVLEAFAKSENSCKNLHNRMDKLKNMEVSHSKSLKHIIKKMDEVVSKHKTELGIIIRNLELQYKSYVKLKQSEENLLTKNTVTNGDSKKLGDLNSSPPILCILSDSDTDVKNVKKCESENNVNNIEDSKNITTDFLKAENSDSSVTNIKENGADLNLDLNFDPNQDNVKDTVTEASKEDSAKAALLCDSSEDSDYRSNIRENGRSKLSSSNTAGQTHITVTAEIHSSELQSDLETEKSSDNRRKVLSKTVDKIIHNTSRKNCAIKESSISSLSSESSMTLSDTESIKSSRKTKGPKRKPQTGIKSKKVEIDYTNDVKLRLQTSVVLDRCDNFLDGKTTIPVPAIFLIDELEKKIKNLQKEPKIHKKSENKKSFEDAKEKKEKGVKKKVRKESSSSIHFSSSEEHDDEDKEDTFFKPKSVVEEKSENEAKKALLDSDDNDSSSCLTSSSSDVKSKKSSKKKKNGTRTDSDSTFSSEDFQPRKKKRIDKLLSKRLLSDESENNKKESSNTTKRKKKRKHLSSGDDFKKSKVSHSDTTTLSDSDDDKQKSKRRKRIKKPAASSSEHSGDKKDKTETPKKGRKDINKIISKRDLTKETKEAQQAEKERKKRIEEKQKLYNVITDTSKDGKEIITKKLVLEIDPISKEEIVEIHPDLIEKLKPHQVNGVKFMWECTIESLKDLEKTPGSGCILAHCMGLGKTLQCVTFLHTCLTNEKINKFIKTAMVICPYNTVLNWSKEIEMWLTDLDTEPISLFEMTVAKDNYTRLDILKSWKKEGGILILSYDIFRRLAGNNIPKLKKYQKNQVVECLLDPGADIVICDEGHILKNEKSAISKACALLNTKRRIVLTGTPLQNNLNEYHCMLSFVKPHLLGTSKEFRNRFINPIINGQYEDSNEYDVRRMKKRIHILHKLLEGCVQRCDYSALTKFLPPKHEYVLSVKLSETQIKMYRWYLDNMSKAKQQSKICGGFLFQDYNSLRNLCIHPYILQMSTERAEQRKCLDKFLDDESSTEESFSTGESGKSGSGNDTDEIVKKHKTRTRKDSGGNESEEVVEVEKKKEWYHEFFSESEAKKVELSGKFVLLLNILRECEEIGDKVIVFTQSLLVLDLIEEVLTEDNGEVEPELTGSFNYSWTEGLDYFRMDGSTSAEYRKHFIDMFNDPANPRARLFLISTKAGGLGTNLVGANRVVILDASWNPSHDVQAIFRVYRFGQKKPVYIYRLLSQGTMEEKIYDRQVTKLSLSIRVVDEQQIDRHFNSAELSELYSFEPEGQRNRTTPMVPSDRLLAEMLMKYKDLIVSYHEHDSLLQNQTEEDLTEEERKAAWNEYENEREGRSAEEISIDEEIAKYCKEPDFDQADYDTPVLPNAKFIIDNTISSLKTKYLGQGTSFLRKKLYITINALKMALKEKHVKVLRIKQEFLAKGSAPSTVNKYIEELNVLITEIDQHLMKLQRLVAEDEANIRKYQAQQLAQAQASVRQTTWRAPNMNLPPGFVVNFSQPNMQQFTGLSQPRMYYSSNLPNRFMYQQNAQKVFTRPPTSTTSQPVVTEEINEEQDLPNATTPSSSSVVIEEIE